MLCVQVHERTLQGDFLIALLRDIIEQRRARGQPLKVLTLPDVLLPCTSCACASTHEGVVAMNLLAPEL